MRNFKITIENKVRHIFKSFGIKIQKIVIEYNPPVISKLYDEFCQEFYDYENPAFYDIYIFGDFEMSEKLINKIEKYSIKIRRKYDIDIFISKENL